MHRKKDEKTFVFTALLRFRPVTTFQSIISLSSPTHTNLEVFVIARQFCFQYFLHENVFVMFFTKFPCKHGIEWHNWIWGGALLSTE